MSKHYVVDMEDGLEAFDLDFEKENILVPVRVAKEFIPGGRFRSDNVLEMTAGPGISIVDACKDAVRIASESLMEVKLRFGLIDEHLLVEPFDDYHRLVELYHFFRTKQTSGDDGVDLSEFQK